MDAELFYQPLNLGLPFLLFISALLLYMISLFTYHRRRKMDLWIGIVLLVGSGFIVLISVSKAMTERAYEALLAFQKQIAPSPMSTSDSLDLGLYRYLDVFAHSNQFFTIAMPVKITSEDTTNRVLITTESGSNAWKLVYLKLEEVLPGSNAATGYTGHFVVTTNGGPKRIARYVPFQK
jgi:hypothetical protein